MHTLDDFLNTVFQQGEKLMISARASNIISTKVAGNPARQHACDNWKQITHVNCMLCKQNLGKGSWHSLSVFRF